ncbi:hypothetical protein K7X08_031006 [Anisodus acutangulus]|uniref:Uncharacterized protein n=1 Tax=Anisodus acutangulus TaxID=402998 RepID=A0A9Q1MLI0_9SOLA|nr:hypothetical protein K7X08_031006 [Anisodus acutangulus]
MEGLDDLDFRMVQSPVDDFATNFKCNAHEIQELDIEFVKSYEIVEDSDTKPLWKHLSEESLLVKMDPNVVLSYRKTLSSERFEHQEWKQLEEIKQLHETGELVKLLEGFPVMNDGFTCESCGEARFVPCPGCNGSQKLFEEEEGKSIRCPHCNENGLVRCPNCCP